MFSTNSCLAIEKRSNITLAMVSRGVIFAPKNSEPYMLFIESKKSNLLANYAK